MIYLLGPDFHVLMRQSCIHNLRFKVNIEFQNVGVRSEDHNHANNVFISMIKGFNGGTD